MRLDLSIVAAGLLASTCQAGSPFFIASTEASSGIDRMRNPISSNDIKQLSKNDLCDLDTVVVIEQPTLQESDLQRFTSQFAFYESSYSISDALSQPSDVAQLISRTCKSKVHNYKENDSVSSDKKSVINVKGTAKTLDGLSESKRKEYINKLLHKLPLSTIQTRFPNHALIITSPAIGFNYFTTPLLSALFISFGILTPILIFAIKALLAISPTPKQSNTTLAQMPPSSLTEKKNK
ncbi:hypothetical protein WALSEDRAFT_70816 [Wallemia mellicola CBS 633.66]|uniref:Protein BIG1 n=1 Tax=Wallemia mellicola (strain ATCC MYA-4683 / CBS 633.66) TaxID=671144 RepID=I4Y5B9_WALMC|nr:hypothetical protein WALSEDRAFT_70816 [Wallemia mellicola CBS 633.66]EIM19161.1 hypothetical protein WALSEDRAFT_70816 [Wallemia mellicola CBS 633.66]|eukprot:XP_006960783.1 hypothetical protein WALSEDRAFT_70816 [Wallemia mellicola CBS 633.66]